MQLNFYKDEDHSDTMASGLEINWSNTALKFQPFSKSITYLPTSGDLKSGNSLFCTTPPPPTPECQQHQHPTHPPFPMPTNCLRTLYDILHEVHGIKMRFHHCNDEQNLCHWLNMCKNVPDTVQWIQKVRILWKNGVNFKLKHKMLKIPFYPGDLVLQPGVREIW